MERLRPSEVPQEGDGSPPAHCADVPHGGSVLVVFNTPPCLARSVGIGDVCHACPCTGIQGTGDTVMANGDAKGTLAWSLEGALGGHSFPGVGCGWSSSGQLCPLSVPMPPNTAFSASLWPLSRAHLPQSCVPAGSLTWTVSVMLRALSTRPALCPVSFGSRRSPSLSRQARRRALSKMKIRPRHPFALKGFHPSPISGCRMESSRLLPGASKGP